MEEGKGMEPGAAHLHSAFTFGKGTKRGAASLHSAFPALQFSRSCWMGTEEIAPQLDSKALSGSQINE